VTALADVLQSVKADGRVARAAADRLRATVKEHGGATLPAEQLLDRLPRFEALPAAARQSLHEVVLRDDAWSMWLRTARWRQALTRTARTIAARIPVRRRTLRHLMDLAETWILMWHARVVHELYRSSVAWRGRTGGEPTLASALSLAGVDPRTLASAYLRGVPQPPETVAYWHDAVRHSTVGVVVGIDFIVNDEGVWFVESNLNAGLMEERSRLYERDPFVENLVAFAKQNGYESLTFLACNDYPVDAILAKRIEDTARAAGIEATVLEDCHAPQGRLGQAFLVPPIADGKTLVVRSKLYHTVLDAFFHNKTVSLQSLEAYQRVQPALAVRVPGTGEQSFPDVLPMNGPFPNLVCKFPERDQGQGVIFLKVPSLDRARAIIADPVEMNRHSVATVLTKLRYRLNLEDHTSVFQAYIPSSLLEGRRLFIARAHVLATPIGLTFLSAHRVVSRLPIPESLPEGLVENSRPYIVNYSLDSEHAAMPADEERKVAAAALDVVRALCWGVEARFQTQAEGSGAARRVRGGR
jgi:hypothetical protein